MAKALLVIVLAFVLMSVTGAAAQDSPYTLRVDVSMISVDVAVFDAAGIPVSNLTKEDFEIFEDGRPQQLKSFASLDSPYNVLLVIDQSGSMYSQVRFVSEAVNQLHDRPFAERHDVREPTLSQVARLFGRAPGGEVAARPCGRI